METLRLALGSVLVLALPLALAGCGSEDDFGRDVEGLWGIQTWTENDGTCDSEGPDVAATKSEKFLGIRRDDSFVPVVIVATCVDKPDCASKVSSGVFGALFGQSAVLEKEIANGYGTEGSISWTINSTGCTGALTLASLTHQSGGKLRFEQKQYAFTDVPTDTTDPHGGGADCSSKSLRAQALKQPCSKYSVITANHVGNL
jgi:hypothetical protein